MASTVRRHPDAADGVLAVVLAVAALVSAKALYDQIHSADPEFDAPTSATIVGSMLAVTVPLAWRRRFPLVVCGAVVAAFIVGRAVVEVEENAVVVPAMWLAMYSAAAHGRPVLRPTVLAVCLAAVVAEVARELYVVPAAGEIEPLLQSFTLAYNAVILALPWLLGAAVRSGRQRERELGARAAELQREREENARQAVFAERVRIARELHDVVAHHVSVMGIQAGAARRVIDHRPEQAVVALGAIEAASRQAVVELQRVLGFLRRADDVDELAPQPGLDQLDDLVAQLAGEHLDVTLTIEGIRRPLAPTLEVSVYRIVQEALTNARKHAAGAAAAVRLRYTPEALEVEILDDGEERPGEPDGIDGGRGLIGMRERATLHGGHLRVGPRPNGGFAVHATFPLDPS